MNPKSVDRYRDRYRQAGGKSDAVTRGPCRSGAHRPSSPPPRGRRLRARGALKVLSRSHKDLIWHRQRQVNQLRSSLREYYPGVLEVFGTDLAHPDAVAVLGLAATPEQGRRLSQVRIASALRRAGRQRNIDAFAQKIRAALNTPQLAAPTAVSDAYGSSTRAAVAVLATMNEQLSALEAEIAEHLDEHPDAGIYRSLPGLGVVLGARVLGEFGDDPNRYTSAKARKNYAGTPPVTLQSGKLRLVTGANSRRTSGSLTVVIDGRSARCTHQPGAQRVLRRAPALEARGITPRSRRSRTVGSASSTDASPHTSTTTRRPRGRTTSKRRPPLPELDRQRRWGVSAPQ